MSDLEVSKCFKRELRPEELIETNGGSVLALFVAYVLIEAIVNPSAHIEALKAGWNSI